MLMIVNMPAMPKKLTSAAVGAIVREARTAAGLSQSELGRRIGASRFWVAQFEKGKPGAELGLALKAIETLGLSVRIEPKAGAGGSASREPHASSRQTDLGMIIARATLAKAAPSKVVGWPTATVPSARRRKS